MRHSLRRFIQCQIIMAMVMGPWPGLADTLVAARTIRANEVITAKDFSAIEESLLDTVRDPAAIIGMEARVALYAGRPIRAGDLSPPALVERNQIVTLAYQHGGLQISTEGRSLGRAGQGETVRAMNLASRNTVTAIVGPNGILHVAGSTAPSN